MRIDKTNFFLIVGVGRSGTSLLQSILSSHPKISIPPETGFLRENLLSVKENNEVTLAEMVSSNPRVKRVLSLISCELPNSFNNSLEFYQYLLEAYKNEHHKLMVGDKDPRLIEYMDAVKSIFPEVQFIHLVRDPRDVLLSKKKARWSKGNPSWYHIFANYIQFRIGEFSGQKMGKDEYFLISYEEILEAPKEAITKVCKYLTIEFVPSMLSFQEKAKELVSEDEEQWKKETMGPLLKNNTGKWKGKLNDWEIVLTEILCKDAFRIGEYCKSNKRENISWIKTSCIYCVAFAFKSIGSLYMYYRIAYQKLLIKWKF